MLRINPTTGGLESGVGSIAELNAVVTVPPPGNYGVLPSDTVVLVAGNITLTLPSAVGLAGRYFQIKKTDAGTTLIIAATGLETIDGQLIKTLKIQWTSITVASDGNNWFII